MGTFRLMKVQIVKEFIINSLTFSLTYNKDGFDRRFKSKEFRHRRRNIEVDEAADSEGVHHSVNNLSSADL